jgi:hypothetical protein
MPNPQTDPFNSAFVRGEQAERNRATAQTATGKNLEWQAEKFIA